MRAAAASQANRGRYVQQRAEKRRGENRIHRRTHDIDSPEANISAQLGDDGTLESSNGARTAWLEMIEEVRRSSIAYERYSQGRITRVGRDGLSALLDPKNRFDHFTGTNDLANSEIAKAGGFSIRQWQRVKRTLVRLGLLCVTHRSVPTGLGKVPGAEAHLQISDRYHFSPAALSPPLREIYDRILARLKAVRAALEAQYVPPRPRRPLVPRDKPKCRIPSQLNPMGWLRVLTAIDAAKAAPTKTYEEKVAEAVAFAEAQAKLTPPGG